MGVSVNETTIEIGKTKKRLEILNLGRLWPFCDGFELLGVHLNAVSTDDVAQVFDFRAIKLALSCIGTKLSITEAVEDQTNMPIMLFLGFGENENVVEVDNTNDVE